MSEVTTASAYNHSKMKLAVPLFLVLPMFSLIHLIRFGHQLTLHHRLSSYISIVFELSLPHSHFLTLISYVSFPPKLEFFFFNFQFQLRTKPFFFYSFFGRNFLLLFWFWFFSMPPDLSTIPSRFEPSTTFIATTIVTSTINNQTEPFRP